MQPTDQSSRQTYLLTSIVNLSGFWLTPQPSCILYFSRLNFSVIFHPNISHILFHPYDQTLRGLPLAMVILHPSFTLPRYIRFKRGTQMWYILSSKLPLSTLQYNSICSGTCSECQVQVEVSPIDPKYVP